MYEGIKLETLDDVLPPLDPWTTEEFEEEVSSALISLYESRVTGQRRIIPSTRLNEDILLKARKMGVFIADPNRICLLDVYDTMYQLPRIASFSMAWDDVSKHDPTSISGYRGNFMAEQVATLPKGFKRMGGGQLYRLSMMIAKEEGGVDGSVTYFSVDKEGIIHNTDLNFNNRLKSIQDKKLLEQEKHIATITLNFWADKVNTWSIIAQEKEAKCEIGVAQEQVKSLLYARALPLTSTGRKRPILHLVAAHRRRMKEGIDIDISKYLRGIETVEIGGTLFTVKPAEVIKLQKK